MEDQPCAASAGWLHFHHVGFALIQLLNDDASVLVIHIDDDFLDGLQLLAGILIGLHHDLRTHHAKLEAFPAHCLDQDCQLEFAPARHGERLGLGRALDLESNIALSLFHKPVPDQPRGDFLALGSRERGIIHPEGHGQRRRVDWLRFDRLRHGRVNERVGNVRLGKAGERDNVARNANINRLALEAAESQHFRHPALLDQLAIARQHLHRLVRLHRARRDAAGQDAAEEVVRRDRRRQHAERAFFDGRFRHMLHHHVEQRIHAVSRLVGIRRHPAILCRAVKDRKIELVIVCAKVCEEIEHLVDDIVRTAVRLVDLVDRHNRAKADLQRLRHNELGLRHRAFSRVHQHNRAVHHVKNTLHLAAKVGVSGRVDNVDPRIAPDDRSRLGEDGDAALTLQIIGVHHPLFGLFILAEGAGLFQQAVDQRGLAVVNVGDDRDIAKGFRLGHGRVGFQGLFGARVHGIAPKSEGSSSPQREHAGPTYR